MMTLSKDINLPRMKKAEEGEIVEMLRGDDKDNSITFFTPDT